MQVDLANTQVDLANTQLGSRNLICSPPTSQDILLNLVQ